MDRGHKRESENPGIFYRFDQFHPAWLFASGGPITITWIPSGSDSTTIAAINWSGEIAGTFVRPSRPTRNFVQLQTEDLRLLILEALTPGTPYRMP